MVHKPTFYEKYIKRLLDIVLSGMALIVLSPVLMITAILVKCRLGSPVIFCQERPGKGEKIFRLYKFRTMRDAVDPRTGKQLPDEERLTPFGKKLRALSLDELPELPDSSQEGGQMTLELEAAVAKLRKEELPEGEGNSAPTAEQV